MGKLTNFNRPSVTVGRMKGTPIEQYMMASPVLRAFVDSIFKSAMKNVRSDMFDVELDTSTKKKMHSLEDIFFNSSPVRRKFSSSYVPKSLILLCFMKFEAKQKLTQPLLCYIV